LLSSHQSYFLYFQPYEHRTPIVAFTAACMADTTMCVTSDAYTCDNLGGIMTSATTWIGILGLMIMAVMMGYKQNWALIAGIGFVTAVSWFRGTAVTYFPDTSEGDARFDYFRKVVSIEPLNTVLTPFTNDLQNVGVALFTFLYVDFLDTSVRIRFWKPVECIHRTYLIFSSTPNRERCSLLHHQWELLMNRETSQGAVLHFLLMQSQP
jgi:hypothetical protein